MKKALLIMLVLAVAIPVMAQTDVGFKGIGGRIAYVDPESGWDPTIGIGVVTDLGTWIPQLHWDASLLFWSTGEDFGYADYTLRDIGLRSSVKYHFIEGPWEPYAGGGIGIHMFNFSYDYNNGYYIADYDDSDTEFGIQILGGVEHQFNAQWKGSAELEFDFEDVGETLLQVNVIYMLGK
jgi:opacity protein-like surface antigen